MKKTVQLLLVICMLVLSAQLAFAAEGERETIQTGADLVPIHRLAIGKPLYMPPNDKAPTNDQLTEIVFDASKKARSYVMSYDAVAESIRAESSVDIKSLDRVKAAKACRENVGKYADAYVIVTVANNSTTIFFFEVFKAGTNELLYTYEVAAGKTGRSGVDTKDTYMDLSEKFYQHFEDAAQKQAKEADKKNKK